MGFAQVLLDKRSLLLADEPTGALDNTAGRESFTFLRHVVVEEILILLTSWHFARSNSF